MLLLLCFSPSMCGEDFYVSPRGADTNPGTLRKPFRSLERARDAVRGTSHTAPVTVWLRGGDYRRSTSFVLTADDSGTADAPVVYRAMAGEHVRLTGGVTVRTFVKWKRSILQADLRAQGITDYGALQSRGMRRPGVAAAELFFRGRAMTLARWPNVGWAYTDAATTDKAQTAFSYKGDRPARWVHAPDAWVHGYWYYDWADHYEKVASIDTATRTVTTALPNPSYGYRGGQRWRVVNVLEELDEPGEWYLDREAGVLYFWPPSPIATGAAELSVLDTPLIRVDSASYVQLRDLQLAVTRSDGIVIHNGEHVRVTHCSIANVGNSGIVIQGGHEDTLEDSEVTSTGDGGVVVDGGDRRTLTAAGHAVARNHIHEYARWSRTYTPAVELFGVGNHVVGNTIDHAPHFGIWVHGNDHIIEANDIHTVAMETADASAYYIGADTTERGNTVRRNYFHNLGLGDINAVYLDDESSGSMVSGNVIRGAARGAKLGGGNDNVFQANKFVNDDIGIHFDARGMGWQKAYFDGTNPALLNRLKAMPYQEEPWRSRYPQLLNFLKQTPGLPTGNVVRDNECWCRLWIDYRDKLTEKNLDYAGNKVHAGAAVWDPAWVAGMGTGAETSVIVRKLTQTGPSQATLTIENEGASTYAGVFLIWMEPGVDGRLLSPEPLPFSLRPGEKTERMISVKHHGPVRVGAYLSDEGFVPSGILMK